MSRTWRALILVLLAFGYTWLRFRHAFDPGMALSNFGDGIGTMGVFAHFRTAFETRGLLANLPTEQLTVLTMDGGMPSPQLATAPWKVAYYLTTSWLSADNVYDGLAAAAFFLNMVAGYAVARFWGVRPVLAVVAALLLANLDNFDTRIRGHLGLTFYSVSLLQLAAGLAFARAPSAARGVVLGLVSAFAFAQNEYYGYFGGIFTAALVVTYLALDRERSAVRVGGLVSAIAAAAVSFVALMVALYPIMLLGKLFPGWFESSQLVARHTHPRGDFTVYATHRVLGLFMPGFSDGFASWNQGNPPEFTFRIGIVVPFAMAVFAWISLLRLDPIGRRRLFSHLAALLVPCIAMMFFAMPEDRRLSLATLTYKVAPIFRVGTRAYLFIDIALVLAFAVACNALLNRGARGVRRGWMAPVVVAVTCLLAFGDVSRMRQFEIPMMPLPADPEPLQVLRKAPPGMVLEVPDMLSSVPAETTYPYLYDYEFHRHVTANPLARPGLDDPDFVTRLDRAALRINRPTDVDLAQLGRSGVRYVLVYSRPGVDVDAFVRSSELETMAADGGVRLFRVRSYDPHGDFWGGFVFGRPVYAHWEGCGQGYEKNGIRERRCGPRIGLGLTNYSSAPLSGALTCGTEGASIEAHNHVTGYRSMTGTGPLRLPFAIAPHEQSAYDLSLMAPATAVVMRDCHVEFRPGVDGAKANPA